MDLSYRGSVVKYMNEERAQLKDRLKKALELREKKPIDLVRDLKIPKSAVSQYLSGRSQNMDSKRMHEICKYLNVSEPWMMGYDVTMERNMQKKNDTLSDIAVRMSEDDYFLSVLEGLNQLDAEQLASIKQMVDVLLKK
jgi:transcriptional regulator with XRE-family HTH domain